MCEEKKGKLKETRPHRGNGKNGGLALSLKTPCGSSGSSHHHPWQRGGSRPIAAHALATHASLAAHASAHAISSTAAWGAEAVPLPGYRGFEAVPLPRGTGCEAVPLPGGSVGSHRMRLTLSGADHAPSRHAWRVGVCLQFLLQGKSCSVVSYTSGVVSRCCGLSFYVSSRLLMLVRRKLVRPRFLRDQNEEQVSIVLDALAINQKQEKSSNKYTKKRT